MHQQVRLPNPLENPGLNIPLPALPGNPPTAQDVYQADLYFQKVKNTKIASGSSVTDDEYLEAKTYADQVFEQNRGI